MKNNNNPVCECTEKACGDERRQFLLSMLAGGAALSLPGLAMGSQISRLNGKVWINGVRAGYLSKINAGDTVHTAKNSSIAFVQGQDAYLLRENSFLTLQGSNGLVDLLRLTTGGLLAVFGKGKKTLKTTQATAGIRGTGVYMGADKDKTYFCTCYGEVALESANGEQSELITSTDRHNARYIAAGGRGFEKAGLIDHGLDELVLLESLVGRKVPENYLSDKECHSFFSRLFG